MMAPYAGGRLRESTASDLSVHCSGIIEAYNALAEGQFPVRVAPSHDGGHGGADFGGVRYPLFQFYGNFPYTAAGLLCLGAGLDAFAAWKLVQLAALTLGGFYAYRCGAAATRRPRASLVAGVVFMTAPYMWADLHARFAFPELVSFNLLPVVTFYCTRAFAARRGPWGYVLLGGVAWSLLALSHNVTFLYASALLGLYFASHLSFDRRFLWRITRVGLTYAGGILLTLWYHAPQFQTVPLLNIRVQGEHPRPVGAELLTPLDVLLAPAMRTPPGSPTERLGLQVGWPALAAFGLALVGLLRRPARTRSAPTDAARAGHFSDPQLTDAAPPKRSLAPLRHGLGGRRSRAAVVRPLIFFAVAFVLAWSPAPASIGFDIWRLMPRVFAYVQSSYRILMFVALFAALLVPYALATRRGRDLPAWATLLVLAAVAWASASYVPRHERLPPDALAQLVAHPILDGLRDYMLAPAVVAQRSQLLPEMNWAEPIHGVVPREAKLDGSWQAWVPTPVIPAGRSGTLTVAGMIPAEGGARRVALQIVLDGKPLEPFEVRQGGFRQTLPLPGPHAGIGAAIGMTATHLGERTGPAAVVLTELRIAGPPPPPAWAFVSAEAMLPSRRTGAVTKFAVDLTDHALVQVPVLYYPGLLRTTLNGHKTGYDHVGRFVAWSLPPGRHEIGVEFVGVRWANWVSAIAWAGTIGGLGIIGFGRVRRWHSARAPARRTTTTRMSHPRRGLRWWESALGATLLFGIIGGGPTREAVQRALYVPLDCTATASRPGDDAHPPAHAFDGDETTFWFVPGGSPATLTIVPHKAEKFRRITLLARKSGLWEAWHKVRVVLYLRGEVVLEKEFRLADADTEPEHELRFKATRANRIELYFSEPVTLTRDAKTRVDPNGVSPGYREIRVE